MIRGLSFTDLVRRSGSPEFMLLRPAGANDPHATYRALAESGPVCRSEAGYWIVTGHEESVQLLTDARLGALSDLASRPDVAGGEFPVLEEFHRAWFLFADPPRHASTRRAVASCTARDMRAAMEAAIEPLAAEMIRDIDWSAPVDVVATLARPYPMAVIGRILGLPQEDLPRLRALTVVMSESMEPFLGEGRLRKAEAAARELRDYFAARRRSAGTLAGGSLDSLLSGETMDPDAGLAHAVLLLTAGQETTVNLIAVGVHALLTDRTVLAGLDDDAVANARAVEEILRFTSPIQLVVRRVLDPVDVAGQRLDPDDLVWVVLAAANRDPRVFDDPDQLVLNRHPNNHIAFATGTHVCFGAALTRAEMRAALAHLVSVLPDLVVDEESTRWQRKRTARGLDRLVVRPRPFLEA